MAVSYTISENQSECDTLHLGIPTFQELRNSEYSAIVIFVCSICIVRFV